MYPCFIDIAFHGLLPELLEGVQCFFFYFSYVYYLTIHKKNNIKDFLVYYIILYMYYIC